MTETASWTMVLLRHDLPDGSWHYDWMLDLPGAAGGGVGPLGAGSERAAGPDGGAGGGGLGPAGGGLVTFRVHARPEGIAPGGTLAAERLADHRRAYLVFEGEIPGGRGRVARLARGGCGLEGSGPGGLAFHAEFDGHGPSRWRADRAGSGWTLTRTA